MTPKVTRNGNKKIILNGGKTMYYLAPIIDEFFEKLFNFPHDGSSFLTTRNFLNPNYPVTPEYPVANIYFEKDGQLNIELGVTGYSKDELDIVVENDVLSIKGNKGKCDDTERKYIHNKLVCKSFMVNYRISDKYDLEKLDVQLKNGLLKISAPLKPEVKPKRKVLEITES